MASDSADHPWLKKPTTGKKRDELPPLHRDPLAAEKRLQDYQFSTHMALVAASRWAHTDEGCCGVMFGHGIDAFNTSVVPQDSGPICCAAVDGESVP